MEISVYVKIGVEAKGSRSQAFTPLLPPREVAAFPVTLFPSSPPRKGAALPVPPLGSGYGGVPLYG